MDQQSQAHMMVCPVLGRPSASRSLDSFSRRNRALRRCCVSLRWRIANFSNTYHGTCKMLAEKKQPCKERGTPTHSPGKLKTCGMNVQRFVMRKPSPSTNIDIQTHQHQHHLQDKDLNTKKRNVHQLCLAVAHAPSTFSMRCLSKEGVN